MKKQNVCDFMINEHCRATDARQAARALQAEDVPCDLLLRPDLGHGLDDAGLAAGTALLARSLPNMTGG